MMKIKHVLPLALACLAMTAHAEEAAPTAQSAVEHMVAGALEAIKLPKKQILKGTGEVRGYCDLVKNSFNVKSIGRSFLPEGVWDKAAPAEQDDYLLAVQGHMANFAAITLLQTAGKPMHMTYQELPPHNGLSIVQIKESVNNVDGKIYLKQGPDGEFRILDLVFGGVSMVGVKKGDFGSAASQGIVFLTQALNKMSTTRMMGATCAETPAKTVSLQGLVDGAGLSKTQDLGAEPK
jgi:ABC-type transporter MlaC component